MPSPIIHVDLLFRLAEELNFLINPNLLLGTISPDAIHSRPNHTWADKSITHFYDEADQSYELALQVATVKLNHLSKDFALGYKLHLLTDYLWRENVYTPFFMTYKDKFSRQELHALYYREMSRLDEMILTKSNWIDEARMLLSKECLIHDFTLLTNEEIQEWCKKVGREDLQIKEADYLDDLEIFNEQVVLLFINQTLQVLKQYV